MNNFGIKISKEGRQVDDATPDELVFDSSKTAFSVAEKGEWSVTLPAGDGGVQNYTTVETEVENPFVYVYINLDNGFYPAIPDKFGAYNATGAEDDDDIWVYAGTDEGDLTISVYSNDNPSDTTYTGTYYVISREMHSL